MKIERAVPSDIEDIGRLLVQVCNVHAAIRPDLFLPEKRKYTDSELADLIVDDTRPIFVARDDDGAVAGYCFTAIEDHEGFNEPPHKTLYIDDLCVDEKVRGQSLGRKLYDFVCGWAKEQGIYNVTLHVWEHNESAIAFYRSMGMKIQFYGMETIL